MDYQEFRGKVKNGDMLLFRNHAGGGPRAVIERWLVVHGTGDPYCHIGMAWVDGDRRVWLMDMTTKGCAPRLLSKVGMFDWAPAPRQLSDVALGAAHDCFGEWTYSRWQAVLGELGMLPIGKDLLGQCAEFALTVWGVDNMAPSAIATPAACADGALRVWKTSITEIENA